MNRIIDRVIGTKVCLKCGHPTVVEGYTVPGVERELLMYTVCAHRDEEYFYCNSVAFTKPKYEVIMKEAKSWLKTLAKLRKS